MSIATFLTSRSINSGVKVGSNGKVIGDSSSLLNALKTGATTSSGKDSSKNIPDANSNVKDTSTSGTNIVKPAEVINTKEPENPKPPKKENKKKKKP